MSTRANVQSIQALQEFKAALATFAQIAQGALIAADMEGRGFCDWLMDDQLKDWQRESRRREDRMTQAKIELTRCRASKVFDHTPSCVDELVAVKRATAHWEAAEAKIQTVRRWDGMLREAMTEFQGNTKALAHAVEIDLPKAMALLEKLTTQLEQYMAIGPSSAMRQYHASQNQPTESSSGPATDQTSDDSTNISQTQESNQS